MPDTRRRGFSRGRGGSQNVSDWVYSQSTVLTAIPAGTKFLLGAFTLSPGVGMATVLRTRGRIWVQGDQNAAVEEQTGSFGMIPVSSLAFAAGVASIPGPSTDGDFDDWFVHESFVQSYPQVTSVSPVGMSYAIDSKAMRKIPDGSVVALVVENFHATFGFRFMFAIRMLAKVTQK